MAVPYLTIKRATTMLRCPEPMRKWLQCELLARTEACWLKP
uniref:Uncharacterized protein n=1 Tax=Anguilla anguilla TaxID=7936 RepID=A0A0E9TZ72_ANGAN